MKDLLITSFALGDQEYLKDITFPAMRSYADLLKADFIEAPILNHSRPLAWGKILSLSNALTTYEHVLWIDADLLLLSPTQDFREEIPSNCVQALVQHETAEGSIPNTGFWYMSSEMTPFLRDIWECYDLINHRWWDNAALLRTMGYTVDPPIAIKTDTFLMGRTHFLDGKWNNIQHLSPNNPFTFHAAGIEDKKLFLERYL